MATGAVLALFGRTPPKSRLYAQQLLVPTADACGLTTALNGN